MLHISDTDEHPTDKKGIIKKYKKDKVTKNKKTKEFQKFLKFTNKILGFLALILIFASTKLPRIKNKYKITFDLFSSDMNTFSPIMLNISFIDKIFLLFKK